MKPYMYVKKISCRKLDRSLLQGVVKRLDLPSQQFEKHQTETSIVITELLKVCKSQNIPIQNISQKNISLKESNESLKVELLECKKTITEMNTKLSIADNEIASLLTVISRIILVYYIANAAI